MDYESEGDSDAFIVLLSNMYHDNVRTLHSLTDTIQQLTASNNQIRSILTQYIRDNRTNRAQRRDIRLSQDRERDRDRRESRYMNRSFSNTLLHSQTPLIEFTIPTNNTSYINELLNSLMRSSAFVEPIEMYPSQAEIETATRRVRYSDIARPINTQCPISLDDFHDNDIVMVIRQCGHTFYPNNLMNWFRTNCKCPVCRYDIRNYRTPPNPTMNNTTNTTTNITPNPNTTTTYQTRSNQPISRMNSVDTNHDNNYHRTVDASGNAIGVEDIMFASELLTSLLRRM